MVTYLAIALVIGATGQATGKAVEVDLTNRPVTPTGSASARLMKDVAADAMGNPGGVALYVKTDTGDDTNTCRSWAYACKTILGAYDKLPSTGGIVYLADNSWVGGEVANQGLWFRGAYGTAAPGYRLAKPTRFIGVAGQLDAQFSRPGRARIIGGHGEGWAADRLKPGIHLATGAQNIVFERVEISGATRAWVSGTSVAGLADPSTYAPIVDAVTGGSQAVFTSTWPAPSGDVTVDVNHLGVWSRKALGTDYALVVDPVAPVTVTFVADPPAGDTVRLSRQSRGVVNMAPLNYAIDSSFVPPVHSTDNALYGPTIDIGFAFWNYFIDCTLHAYSPTDNSLDLASNRHAILYASDAGLIYVQRGIGAGGGSFKTAAGGLILEDFLVETDYRAAAPAVWYESTAGALGGLWGYIKNVYRADNAGGTYPDVQFDIPCPDCAVIGPATVTGGVTLLGGAKPFLATSQADQRGPIFNGQTGFINGYVEGISRTHRRSFGPQAVRYTNLLGTPSGATITFTPNQPGPDGRSTATLATVNPGAGSAQGISYASISFTPVVGERVFAGMWVKAPNGITTGSDAQLNLTFAGPGVVYSSRSVQYPRLQGAAGTWFWIFSAATVTATAGNAGGAVMGVRIGEGYPVVISDPILVRIPAGDMTDDEFMEFAYATLPWGATAPVGSKAMAGDLALTDGKVWMQGTTISTGTGDPSNVVTANPGSLYLRLDPVGGSTTSSLYVKTSGTGYTGWTAK